MCDGVQRTCDGRACAFVRGCVCGVCAARHGCGGVPHVAGHGVPVQDVPGGGVPAGLLHRKEPGQQRRVRVVHGRQEGVFVDVVSAEGAQLFGLLRGG